MGEIQGKSHASSKRNLDSTGLKVVKQRSGLGEPRSKHRADDGTDLDPVEPEFRTWRTYNCKLYHRSRSMSQTNLASQQSSPTGFQTHSQYRIGGSAAHS